MADLTSSDYYENLGVARSATEQEIKTAYVALAVDAADSVGSAAIGSLLTPAGGTEVSQD